MLYIAEIGVNHNGSCKTAFELIAELYEETNLHKKINIAVKLQLWSEHQFPAIEHLRLTQDEIISLFVYCESLGFTPFATAFSKSSLEFLKGKQNIWKVPSGLLCGKYFEAIKSVADPKDLILLSNGLEIQLIKYLSSPYRNCKYLYCISKYPTNYSDINLNEIAYYKFDGISDHTPTIDTSVAACALGAKYIEKHVTIDKDQEGPDHASSITPKEFAQMISMCENIRKAFTGGENKSKNYKKIKEAMSNWENF